MTNIDQISTEEKRSLDELRIRMQNVLPENILENSITLYKFLKARDFDLDKTEKMLRKHINWRKALQVDTICEDFRPLEFFPKYPRMSDIGFDKDGDMVKYSPCGKLDGRDILKCCKMNHYVKHWIWYTEDLFAQLKQLNAKTGRQSNQISVIVNLDELTIGNATNKQSTEICIRLMHILQDNYPEFLKSMHIVNSPSYYVFIYSILKTMMSSHMLRKIHVYGHSGWKEKLLDIIDADVLPAFLGGNRTDPDGNPLCNTFIIHGGKIPEIYHLTDEDRYFKDKTRVKEIMIPKQAKEEIFLEVTEVGSMIQWEFLVKHKDIGFGLYLKKPDEVEEILPEQRYDTIDGTEIGSYRTKFTGKYFILFDNSYSRFSSKEIEYIITVVKPVK